MATYRAIYMQERLRKLTPTPGHTMLLEYPHTVPWFVPYIHRLDGFTHSRKRRSAIGERPGLPYTDRADIITIGEMLTTMLAHREKASTTKTASGFNHG
jgi:hypothetical protein